jgi:DNA-directed RNA polymerase subunit alpha
MLKTRNFGRKSLNEIRDILDTMGLTFGMNFSHLDVTPEELGLSGKDREKSE